MKLKFALTIFFAAVLTLHGAGSRLNDFTTNTAGYARISAATNGYPWGVLYDPAGTGTTAAQAATNGYPWLALVGNQWGTNGGLLYPIPTGGSPYSGIQITSGDSIYFNTASGVNPPRLSYDNPSSAITVNSNLTVSGTVTALAFVGNGSGLTNLPVSAQTNDTTKAALAGNQTFTGTNTFTQPLVLSGGLSVSSMTVSNLSGNAAGLTNINLVPVVQTLTRTSGTNCAVDMSLGNAFTVTLNGTNLYFTQPQNLQAMKSVIIEVIQGTWLTNTVGFNTNYWLPPTYGQILTMPTNTTGSRQFISVQIGSAATTNFFIQTLFP